jgi:hypothetical protein
MYHLLFVLKASRWEDRRRAVTSAVGPDHRHAEMIVGVTAFFVSASKRKNAITLSLFPQLAAERSGLPTKRIPTDERPVR